MAATTARAVLITGASGGIGRATAARLAQAGHHVYAGARRAAALDGLRALGCHPLLLDVTSEDALQTAVQAVEQARGGVEVLINNAGYGLGGPVELLDPAEVRREFETNVFGLVRLTQLVLPTMRAAGWGRIVNVGSVGGSFTAPGAGAYHASKYAVEAFSDALRMEARPFGVRVVLIKPTGVASGFAAAMEHQTPLPPLGSPYRAFAERHRQVTRELFGTRARLAGIVAPETVAQAIQMATEAARPPARLVVGLSGHAYLALRRVLPDRAWDAVMARQFSIPPRPRAGGADRG